MGDGVQVLIVSVVALAALTVLVRPFFARDKAQTRSGGGCSNCAAGDREPTEAGRGGQGGAGTDRAGRDGQDLTDLTKAL